MSLESSPVSSISRDSESIQTLTPCLESSCNLLDGIPLRYLRGGRGKRRPRMADMSDAERRRELGQQLRVDSVRMSAVAKSGHPTSAMSAADLMAVLVDGYLRYDFAAPKSPANDRLVFSKGHASTLLYAIYRAAGAISEDELLTYRTLGSRLEGHPTPVLPWVDVANGLARPGACRSASGWRSRGSTSTGSRTGSGSCAATARWPRARCGRRSSTRRTTSSTT